MYEDGSGAVSVQSLIYSYQEGLKKVSTGSRLSTRRIAVSL